MPRVYMREGYCTCTHAEFAHNNTGHNENPDRGCDLCQCKRYYPSVEPQKDAVVD